MKRSLLLWLAVVVAGTLAAPTASAEAKTVYVLGDSITKRMEIWGLHDSFERLTEPASWRVVSRGVTGRAIGSPSPAPNGLDQAETDQGVIAQAAAVVIELGTNPQDGNRFRERMRTLLLRVQKLNPAAPIYWVAIGHHNDRLAAQARTRNRQMRRWRSWAGELKLPAELSLRLIAWDELAAANAGWFAADSTRLHPNRAGTQELVKLIRKEVAGR